MRRTGAGLWRSLVAFQVYGANTNVGKTVASTILCKVLGDAPKLRARPGGESESKSRVHYLKPVSTGPVEHVDSRHVSSFLEKNISTETLFQFSRPVSPHIAARLEGNIPSDEEILGATHGALRAQALAGAGAAIVETAGGVLSPAPSGSSQADLYRPLRLPALLVGDHHLGGIATTVSAYESLRLRGYDVWLHVVFQEPEYMNVEYLSRYFAERGVRTLALPKPPKVERDAAADQENMWNYYSEVTNFDSVHSELNSLVDRHEKRMSDLDGMSQEAANVIWYPFTQHKSLKPEAISVIDSAYQDSFDMLAPRETDSALQLTFDASASWWTQGLGHGNPRLALAAAYAAGRYGHVMFASCVHEPALELARTLLRRHDNPRLARVFFSDNGSTGVEVAVKMALRSARRKQNWAEDHAIDIIGLKGSYHGDTIGAMDCAEQSAYNKQEAWYTGRGFWFDYPKIRMTQGKWVVDMPQDMESGQKSELQYTSLSEIFDRVQEPSDSKVYREYTNYVEKALRKQSRSFGALILEPVVLGAGGMVFVDPLFQRALVDTVRKLLPHVPVIFDEVFTGIYRLGRFNCNGLVGATPDVVVNAKLLTGGVVPLCTTSASQEIFEAFISDNKTDCLLHGHSYTAHPVGCNVAVESLNAYKDMEESGHWANRFGRSWAAANTEQEEPVWSVWDPVFVEKLSFLDDVEGVVALGTVLAITLKDSTGGGYSSSAAADLQKRLMLGKDDGFPVHSRVLGNVIYFITSLTVEPQSVDQIQSTIVAQVSGEA